MTRYDSEHLDRLFQQHHAIERLLETSHGFLREVLQAPEACRGAPVRDLRNVSWWRLSVGVMPWVLVACDSDGPQVYPSGVLQSWIVGEYTVLYYQCPTHPELFVLRTAAQMPSVDRAP